MLTYEAPKQSPPALKEEENGDSNIQVGTARDQGLEMGEGSLGGQVPVHPISRFGGTQGGIAQGEVMLEVPGDWGCERAGSRLRAMK